MRWIEVNWGYLRGVDWVWCDFKRFHELSRVHVVLKLEGIGILRMAPESFQAWTKRETMQPRKVWCLRPRRQICVNFAIALAASSDIINHQLCYRRNMQQLNKLQLYQLLGRGRPKAYSNFINFHEMSVLAQYGLYNIILYSIVRWGWASWIWRPPLSAFVQHFATCCLGIGEWWQIVLSHTFIYMNFIWICFGLVKKHETTFKVEALPLQNGALAGHLLHFTSSYFIVSFLFPLHKT